MKSVEKILIIGIFLLVGATVYINYAKHLAIDRSKIPEKVEESRGFQKWITNLKNKEIDVNADEFRLKEENEVYNTKDMAVYSMDAEGISDLFYATIEAHKDLPHVAFSPSERQFLDYRYEKRDEYEPNEVHYFGLRDDKLIDSRILTCSVRANCYFDRAYFLDNHVFVISEFSRNLKKDDNAPACEINEICTYTIKVHVIDLINNQRLVYESEPIELNLEKTIPEL